MSIVWLSVAFEVGYSGIDRISSFSNGLVRQHWSDSLILDTIANVWYNMGVEGLTARN